MKLMILVPAAAVVVVAAGTAFALGNTGTKAHETSSQKKVVVSSTVKTSSADSSSRASAASSSTSVAQKQSNQSTTQKSAYDELPQSKQIAAVIAHLWQIDQGQQTTDTNFKIYMGTPNKYVIFDNGGAGGYFPHLHLIQDNHDGSLTVYEVDSSAEFTADQTKDNSYWKPSETLQKSDLMKMYNDHQDAVNQLVPEVDMSTASQSFTDLPEDQMQIPNK